MVFRTKGGKAALGIRELAKGLPLRTSELALAMGVIPRRVHSYMYWAIKAGAVIVLERGRTGGGGASVETIWGIGETPTEFGPDHRKYRIVPRVAVDRDDIDPLPVRRRNVPAEDAPRVSVSAPVSVFTWGG